MPTPVFCCGFECGANVGTSHTLLSGASTWNTDLSFVRSGLRSARLLATAQNVIVNVDYGSSQNIFVIRVYVYFSSLPTADWSICWTGHAGSPGAWFKQSDSKIYAGITGAYGATGVSVTTGAWYRIDVKVNASANPWTIDAKVEGTDCGQKTNAVAAATNTEFHLGHSGASTVDAYFDDLLVSNTNADYPLGAGFIKSYIPNGDGTHNVAGTNDFERTLTGTDIDNTTTTAWQLVSKRPLEGSAGEFINCIAPPNATDYVECTFEDSGESSAPRSVEAIIGRHGAAASPSNNLRVALRDSAGATQADIFNGDNSETTLFSSRAHFATIPGGGAWTDAAFDALVFRVYSSDPAPDSYLDSIMLEAEYAAAAILPPFFPLKSHLQAVNRSHTY